MSGTIIFGGLTLYALSYAALIYKAHKRSVEGLSEKKSIKLVKYKKPMPLRIGTNAGHVLNMPTYKIGKDLKGKEILERFLIVLSEVKGKLEFENSDMVYNDLCFIYDFMKGLNKESLEDFVNLSAFHELVAIVTISNSISKGIFTQDNQMLIQLLVEVSHQLKESRLRYIKRHSKDMGEELMILKKTKDLGPELIQY